LVNIKPSLEKILSAVVGVKNFFTLFLKPLTKLFVAASLIRHIFVKESNRFSRCLIVASKYLITSQLWGRYLHYLESRETRDISNMTHNQDVIRYFEATIKHLENLLLSFTKMCLIREAATKSFVRGFKNNVKKFFTPTTAERIFSRLGLMLTKRRLCLDGKRSDRIMFLSDKVQPNTEKNFWWRFHSDGSKC
jgi:hypothetical protein